MRDLDSHARASADIRRAADFADGLATSLRKLNDGPTFDYERKKLLEDTQTWFLALAKILREEAA